MHYYEIQKRANKWNVQNTGKMEMDERIKEKWTAKKGGIKRRGNNLILMLATKDPGGQNETSGEAQYQQSFAAKILSLTLVLGY